MPNILPPECPDPKPPKPIAPELPPFKEHDPACCGDVVCAQCFEQGFMRQVRMLYPPFDGKLCPDGIFDRLIKSLVHPIYSFYTCNCGLCDIPSEVVPHLSCCTFDRWVEEYGLLDDPCFEPVCFLTAQQRVLSLRAQLQAYFHLEFGGTFNQALIDGIAEPLGIRYKIVSPHLKPDGSPTGSSLHGVGGLQTPRNNSPAGPDDCRIQIAGSFNCRIDGQIALLRITAAPRSIFARACDVVAQPFQYNPYVEAFKCLLQRLKPCHLNMTIVEDYSSSPPTFPPSFRDPCPASNGAYVAGTLSGDGTEDAPYELGLDQLSLLSVRQARNLAGKLIAVNP